MRNRDSVSDEMERNENPDTMAGAVGGAAGVGAGAGLGLATLGPVGGVIGALVGAAGGWWAGRGMHEAVEQIDREDNRFRRAHEHAGATRPYEEVRHAYQLGYLAGRNPDYSGADFATVEADLQGAWEKAHLGDRAPVPWDEVRSGAYEGFLCARE